MTHFARKYVYLSAMSSLLLACSSDKEPYGEMLADTSQISVSSDDRHISFGTGDEQYTLHINASDNLDWVAKVGEQWVTLSNTSGRGAANIIVRVAGDNPGPTKRSTSISVRSQRFNKGENIVVEQAGGYINVPGSVSFPAMSAARQVTVESNVAWVAQSPFPALLQSVSPDRGSAGTTVVTLRSATNTKAQDDTQYLGIAPAAGGSSVPVQLIKLTREKVTLAATVSGGGSQMGREGGSFTLNVQSNSQWTISSYLSWITPSRTDGTGNADVTFTVARNPATYRQCTFYVVSGMVRQAITVSQEGMPIPGEDDNPTPRYN